MAQGGDGERRHHGVRAKASPERVVALEARAARCLRSVWSTHREERTDDGTAGHRQLHHQLWLRHTGLSSAETAPNPAPNPAPGAATTAGVVRRRGPRPLGTP